MCLVRQYGPKPKCFPEQQLEEGKHGRRSRPAEQPRNKDQLGRLERRYTFCLLINAVSVDCYRSKSSTYI